MSSFVKLIEKFVYKQNEITINDVRGLLNGFDYEEHRSPGSHLVFRKKGKPPIIVPTVKGRDVKRRYIKKIVDILNLEEYIEDPEKD